MAGYQLDSLRTGDRSTVGTAAKNAWRQWCCDIHGEFDIAFDSDSYRGQVVRQRSAAYQLIAWSSDSEHIRRNARAIARDPRGHYELLVPLRGALAVGRDAPDVWLRPGEMAIVPVDSPFVLAHAEGVVAATLMVPHQRFADRLAPDVGEGQRIVSDRGLSRVARDLVLGLVRERANLSEAHFDPACDHLVDLISLAATGTGEGDRSHAGASSVRAAVQRYVREHVSDPDLSVTTMSAAIGWSSRYIQAVLARHGTTASGLIRAERLALARTRLASPAFAQQTITAIALSAGFRSPSAFSTAYRRHFGCTPNETRSQDAVRADRR